MNKNDFDEMQTSRRDHIGHQMFIMLVFLLLADTLLYNLGIRWLAFPTDIFLIVLVCCGVFVVRTVFADAFMAPKAKPGKTVALGAGVFVAGLAVVMLLAYFFKPNPAQGQNTGSDIAAVLLEAVSWGFIIVAAVAYLVKEHSGKNREE